jgi:hypothetical protein
LKDVRQCENSIFTVFLFLFHYIAPFHMKGITNQQSS